MTQLSFEIHGGETSQQIAKLIRKAMITTWADQIHARKGGMTHYWAKYRQTECTREAIVLANYADED